MKKITLELTQSEIDLITYSLRRLAQTAAFIGTQKDAEKLMIQIESEVAKKKVQETN
jgi:hypothetical protein